ncbi:MAG: ferrous iron transport protein B [Tannerellaceae bacterium]|jgi:ferrous iron transport protein B|nr:ferrous iron transport protein B [Tannerellaceae bacterium]
MKLSELNNGETGIIVKVAGRGVFRKRIMEMGFIGGKEVTAIRNAPLKDPVHYHVMGYDVSLRRSEAALIEILPVGQLAETEAEPDPARTAGERRLTLSTSEARSIAIERGRTINVALAGNPNSGKTTLFNVATGAHEHVGNYSGVTVDAKCGSCKYGQYTFRIVDLPGAYSMASYSPEERYVRKHLEEEYPDVIVNIVDASNPERNFYLTAQLIDMDMPMVVALNMYDSLRKSGASVDCESLSNLIGAPVVPVAGRSGYGMENLFSAVIRVYERNEPSLRHIHINYGEELELGIAHISSALEPIGVIDRQMSKRLLAIRLLENDPDTESFIRSLPGGDKVMAERDEHSAYVEGLIGEDTETAMADARYGFVSGALKETFRSGSANRMEHSKAIDCIVTHRLLGFPIFLFFMWLMFEATFRIGAWPMEWIEAGVAVLGEFVSEVMPPGPLRDLAVDGIIGGVGGVLVFLPNILILYLFISFMEDSGYMARAAFIMDRIMHRMGLHGKSFIPLVMGFGCNVPAIMASRTIESPSSRMVTMLVNPLMSCSARLPVYLLLVGVFFKGRESTVLFALYASGIALAALMARIFKRFLFRGVDLPFVMELPPYRLPTMRSVFVHVWDKGKQYLRKMGGVILIASIIIWCLGYFPLQPGPEGNIAGTGQSYIGRMGKLVEPALRPLGFDWKMGVGLLGGMAAKEVVVSALGVIGMPEFSPVSALAFMFFVLIYFPCIATITAISAESGSWKWGAFTALYTCALAWIVSFIVYQAGTWLCGSGL